MLTVNQIHSDLIDTLEEVVDLPLQLLVLALLRAAQLGRLRSARRGGALRATLFRTRSNRDGPWGR